MSVANFGPIGRQIRPPGGDLGSNKLVIALFCPFQFKCGGAIYELHTETEVSQYSDHGNR